MLEWICQLDLLNPVMLCNPNQWLNWIGMIISPSDQAKRRFPAHSAYNREPVIRPDAFPKVDNCASEHSL